MDITKPAVWAVVILPVWLPWAASAAPTAQPSVTTESPPPSGSGDRTAALVEAYRSRRPGTVQVPPGPAHRPDPAKSRREPPAGPALQTSGRTEITLPAGRTGRTNYGSND